MQCESPEFVQIFPGSATAPPHLVPHASSESVAFERLAQGPAEVPELPDHGVGVLEGGEVPTPIDGREGAQVEPGLDQLPGWAVRVAEEGDARGHADPCRWWQRRP